MPNENGPTLSRRSLARLAAVATAAAAVDPASAASDRQVTNPERFPYRCTMRPEIVGSVGIVAAGRHYAVAAGTRMLAAGGNAIDAGVAAVFAAA